jgi:hypothetical protein
MLTLSLIRLKRLKQKRLDDFQKSNPASFLPTDISLSVEELRVGLEDGIEVNFI